MSAALPDGAFPQAGPVVYLADDPGEAQAMLGGGPPPAQIWFHATDAAVIGRVIWEGLTPSCWRAGDCCAVCGHDERDEVRRHEGRWVLEIDGPALPGELKAWWVPAEAIRGAWRDGRFATLAELRERFPKPPPADPADGCACELAPLVRNQQARWRQTFGE